MAKIKITDIELDGPEPLDGDVFGDDPQLLPIVVTKDHKIVDGRRRLAQMRRKGADEIDAIVLDDSIDPTLAGLILNTRRSPNPASESRLIRKLLDAGMTQKEIAKHLGGVSQAWISLRQNLATNLIPELFDGLEKGTVLVSVATRAMKLPKDKQRALLNGSDKITVKEVEQAVREHRNAQIDVDSIVIPPLVPDNSRQSDFPPGFSIVDLLELVAKNPIYSDADQQTLLAAVRILKGEQP